MAEISGSTNPLFLSADPYPAIIRQGAERITAALRACNDQPVFAYAVFTTDERDGEIVTATGWDSTVDAPLGGFEIIRVRATDRWNAIPYSDIAGLLFDACRRQPILPKPQV